MDNAVRSAPERTSEEWSVFIASLRYQILTEIRLLIQFRFGVETDSSRNQTYVYYDPSLTTAECIFSMD